MTEKTKITTVSVRIEENLMRQVDKVTEIIPMNKSDFLRGCLEKLCKDNKMLLDHCDKVPEYVEFIKNELKKLPANMIKVKNGSWTDVKDSTIAILCDFFWNTSEIVFENWSKFLQKYDLQRGKGETPIETFSDAEKTEGLIDLENLLFISAEKSGEIEKVDIPYLLRQSNWVSDIEADIISLIYAVKTAFEDEQPRIIIKKYLEKAAEEDEEEQVRLVIDAKGGFRRSGYVLHLPVYTEKVETTGES